MERWSKKVLDYVIEPPNVLWFPSPWISFYVNVAFYCYFTRFEFLLLIAESILIGKVDKILFLRSHQLFKLHSHGVFKDRESWLDVSGCHHTQSDFLKWKLLLTLPDFLILAPIFSHAHQPLCRLSANPMYQPLTSSLAHALSTDSSNLLDYLLPCTPLPSSLDLGIISPGKPSLHWFSSYFSSTY